MTIGPTAVLSVPATVSEPTADCSGSTSEELLVLVRTENFGKTRLYVGHETKIPAGTISNRCGIRCRRSPASTPSQRAAFWPGSACRPIRNRGPPAPHLRHSTTICRFGERPTGSKGCFGRRWISGLPPTRHPPFEAYAERSSEDLDWLSTGSSDYPTIQLPPCRF